jgi:hypothetical protein
MEHLTKQELIELTGYKRHSAQKEWLRKNGYTIHGENRYGTPIVIFKDVYGFRRDGLSIKTPPKEKWQPPPQGGENGQTTQSRKSMVTRKLAL